MAEANEATFYRLTPTVTPAKAGVQATADWIPRIHGIDDRGFWIWAYGPGSPRRRVGRAWRKAAVTVGFGYWPEYPTRRHFPSIHLWPFSHILVECGSIVFDQFSEEDLKIPAIARAVAVTRVLPYADGNYFVTFTFPTLPHLTQRSGYVVSPRQMTQFREWLRQNPKAMAFKPGKFALEHRACNLQRILHL